MNKDLCTSLDASKMLAETGIMAGVEADGYFALKEFTDRYPLMPAKYITEAYRLDKILAVLPEWCCVLGSGKAARKAVKDIHLLDKIENMLCENVKLRGQAAANAAAELAHLLWSNKLLPEVKE